MFFNSLSISEKFILLGFDFVVLNTVTIIFSLVPGGDYRFMSQILMTPTFSRLFFIVVFEYVG